jgi:hypothetical protein
VRSDSGRDICDNAARRGRSSRPRLLAKPPPFAHNSYAQPSGDL